MITDDIEQDNKDEKISSDRRSNKLRLDKSFNIGNLLGIAAVIWALYQGIESVKTDFRVTSARVTIMWEHFKREHNDVTAYEKDMGDSK